MILKRFLAIFLTAALVLCGTAAVCMAEGEETELIKTYSGAIEVGVWLNVFDEEEQCIGYDYVIFNAAAPFTGVWFERFWSGVSDKGTDTDAQVQLFAFDKDYETSVAAKPVFDTGAEHHDKDLHEYTFEFGAVIPAGQYVLKITQLGDRGDTAETTGKYICLPVARNNYTSKYLTFGNAGSFGFGIHFVKTEGVSEYFLPLNTEGPEIEVLSPEVLIPRDPANSPFSMKDAGEFAFLTPEVPEGKVIYSFIFGEAPTWNNTAGNSDLYYEVFRWKGDFDTSYSSKPVYAGEVLHHTDNRDMILTFNTALRYGERWLVVCSASNDGPVGFWHGVSDEVPEGWEFFVDGEPSDVVPSSKVVFANVGELPPMPTEEPTAEPTKEPEATEIPETDVPENPTAAPTDAPATDAPATDAPADEKKGCGNAIVSGAAVLALLGAAVCLRKKH